jgi:AsmA protein
MKSLFKWLGIVLGGLLGLLIVLSLVAGFLIDIEDYRDDIATAVSNATGRTLTIDGELSLRTFPCCGVRIGQVSLSNAPDFPEGHFAKAESASVSVQLLPLLLSQELLVDEVEIDQLDLQLISRANGQVNWAFDTDTDSQADAAADADSGLSGIDIGGVQISESRILYRDEATGDDIQLTGLNLDTSSIASGEPFSLTGKFGAQGLVDGAIVTIELDTQADIDLENSVLNLKAAQIVAKLDGKDLPNGQLAFAGSVAEVLNIGAEAITLQGVAGTITTADIAADVSGNGSFTDAGLSLTGTLNVDTFSPRELLAALGEEVPNTADSKVLQKLAFAGDLELKGDTAKLDNLSLQLDDTKATGMLRLASIEKNAVRFDLKLDQLDLDRYLEPETDPKAKSASKAKQAAEEDGLPVEMLKALDLNGKLEVGTLRVADLELTNTNVKITADTGWIRMKPLTATLFGGSYSGDIRLNVRKYVPSLALEEKIKGIQIDKLTAALTEEEASVIGVGDLSFTGGASGRTVDELIDGMTGTMLVNMQDGKYLGTDIWYDIRKVLAGIDKSPAPPAPTDPFTPIEQLKAKAKLKRNLRVDNQELDLRVPFMRITGNGIVDFKDSTLDYKLNGKVTETPVFDDGTELDKLNGLALSLGLAGNIDDPSVKVDFGSLAQSAAKSALGKEKDKQVGRLFDKLGLGGNSEEAEEPIDGEAPVDASGEELQDTQPAEDPKDQLKKSLRGLFDN